MRIAASDVTLHGQRDYVSKKAQGGIFGVTFGSALNLTSRESTSATSRDVYARSEDDEKLLNLGLEDLYKDTAGNFKELSADESHSQTVVRKPEGNKELDPLDQIHISLLRMLLQLVRSFGFGENNAFAKNIQSQLDALEGGNTTLFNMSMSYSLTSYEAESTQFRGYGRAVTEDGRVIDFDISFGMSNEFMEYNQVQPDSLRMMLMDPLVINVGSDITEISDQTFYFDLDADGFGENVHQLGSGSGFLAVDKNEDGIIGDGSELFGAISGDGFGELREYDEDGNGWIDENDENSWKALKVWIKDSQGRDKMLTLREANVGAIYLGEVATQYDNTSFDGQLKGVVRSSGMYLKEDSGMAGTVQHVDLAVHKG